MTKLSPEQIISAAITDDRETLKVPCDNDNKQRFLENLGFSCFDLRGEAQAFRGILLTEIKRVFDANQDKAHWKNPFVATVSLTEVSALLAGIELYQGARGESTGSGDYALVTIKSPGYQA